MKRLFTLILIVLNLVLLQAQGVRFISVNSADTTLENITFKKLPKLLQKDTLYPDTLATPTKWMVKLQNKLSKEQRRDSNVYIFFCPSPQDSVTAFLPLYGKYGYVLFDPAKAGVKEIAAWKEKLRMGKYQWDNIHDPAFHLGWFDDESEGAAMMIAGEELLKNTLQRLGLNACAYCQKCNETSVKVDGKLYYLIGDKKYKCSFGILKDDNTIEPKDQVVQGLVSDETTPQTIITNSILVQDRQKFVVLIKASEQSTSTTICDATQDYGDYCNKQSAFKDQSFTDKVILDIKKCALQNHYPILLTQTEITTLLKDLQSQARSNQQFEFIQNGIVYRLNAQNEAEVIQTPASDADINAGSWTDGNIDMKMRIGFNADGILQFAALGIKKDLKLASDFSSKSVTLNGGVESVTGNMLLKNNALLKEYKVKSAETTLNDVGANLDSEKFPDDKKVEIKKDASFIKILCEAGGIGISFLKTAEIEKPVYLASETATTIKAPPIGTGALEAGAMAVTDITSMVSTIHDLVTDKQARKDAVEGLKAIKDQVADKPTLLFPILGEVILQEVTGSGTEGYKEISNKETDNGRKGHLISKTSVRTAVSVFASGKFIAKLPDMATQMAAKMPKAKLWLRFREVDEALSANLLKKLDNLPDKGNKFLDDFVGATDESLNKFLKQPEMLEAWKKMDNLGADEALRKNPGALEALSKPYKSRPKPSDYLDKEYIDNHLKKFENDDIVRVTSEKAIKDFNGTLGPDDAFVMPLQEYNKMIFETGGDLRKIETKLGFEPKTLGDDVVFAQIKRSNVGDIKIPSGNESGVSPTKWLPGGKTSGGVSEAIVDLKKIVPFERLSYK